METKKPTLLGKTLSTLRMERQLVRDRAVSELWKRNNLKPDAEGYRVAETSTIQRDGVEVTEYRLYQLVDRAVVRVSSKITTGVEYGIPEPDDGITDD